MCNKWTCMLYNNYVHYICTFIVYIYYVHYCLIMFVHVLWIFVIRGCYDASYNVHWMYISSGESYIFVNNLCYLQKCHLQKCTNRNSKCSFNVKRCKVRQYANATYYMSGHQCLPYVHFIRPSSVLWEYTLYVRAHVHAK